jgi:anaerobic magnesium-protoporphyrin IX monomethyl ester cyclase
MLIDLIRVPDPNSIDDLLDEPLGLMYLGAGLKKNSYQARITNLAGCSFENWKSRIKEADLYGIQLYTPTANIGIEIAKFIKANFPGRPVICGGAHPTALPDSEELHVFDNIVVGEGENSIVAVADSYRDKRRMPRLVKSNFIEDLNTIPFPDRGLVDMGIFHRKVGGERCFGIIGSRGCHYKCAFCDRSLFGEKLRMRSIDNVVEEIKEAVSGYGIRHFEFFDDIFLSDKKQLSEFKRKVDGLGIIYRCNSRADTLPEERYRMLYDSGCRTVCFGIESGSQKILNAMRKGTRVEQNFKAIKMAREAGLTTIGYFILGFPGETKETIRETLEFIKKSDTDQAQFYTFIPLPGCEAYKYPERFGARIISRDFSDYYLIAGEGGRGGKTVDTEYLTADELQEELTKIRQFLKERGSRGHMQDYYVDKLQYKKGEERVGIK